MTTPLTVHVAMAFDGSTWQTPRSSITWTDVTSNVLHADGVSIDRGRSGDRGEVRAGKCSFTLQDFDRSFDPENTAGDYYGFLTPGVPVWVYVSVTEGLEWDGDPIAWDGDPLLWASDLYDRFYGFVEDWPQGSHDPADKRVLISINATDAFGMLALGRQSGVMQNAVMALDPVGYWPLTEAAGTRAAVDLVGANPGTPFDEPVFGSTPLVPALGTCVEFDGTNDRIDISRSALIEEPLTVGMTVSAVMASSIPAEALSIHPIFAQLDGNTSATGCMVYVETDGTVSVKVVEAGTASTVGTDDTVDDGLPYLVIAQNGGGIGGVALNSATLQVAGAPAFVQIGNGTAIGGTPFAAAGYDDNHFPGFISHVALWDRQLTVTERQTLVAAFEGLAGQTTDERIGYILDKSGFPAADRDLTTGYTRLGEANHEGQFTLDLIRRVEKSEQGRFFIAKNGDATFHARYHGQLVATTSSATFSDDGTEIGYSQVEVNRPRANVYNKVTVQADGLTDVTVSDATSISSHGERELTVDAPLLSSTTQQRSLAEFVLTNSKDPQPWVTGLTVPLHKDPSTLLAAVLPLEQGDRVTFDRTPLGVGAGMTWEQTLEGYSERFDTTSWTWSPQLSPAEPVTFGVWSGTGDEHEWDEAVWGY